MFRSKTIFRALMALLLVMALIAGGFALYRVGFTQGYSSGVISEGDGSALALPEGFRPGLMPHYGFGYGHPMGFFFIGRLIGLFFFFGLLFMIFGGIKRMFWYRHWRAAGRDSEAWKKWYQQHPAAHKWGPPPWAGDEESSDLEGETGETEDN